VRDEIKKAVEAYQCTGCVCGGDISCYVKHSEDHSCEKHVQGTMVYPHVGNIFLGLPNGFDRIGSAKEMRIHIYESLNNGWEFDKFNVPVWKHFDKNGNTLVRGILPRLNAPFLHIFIGDHRNDIECIEITESDIDGMD
jgi:hypothetical protein